MCRRERESAGIREWVFCTPDSQLLRLKASSWCARVCVCVCREEAHSLAHMHAGAGEIRADGFIGLVIVRLFDVVTACRWTLLGFDFFQCECICAWMYVFVCVCACEGRKSCFACGSGGVYLDVVLLGWHMFLRWRLMLVTGSDATSIQAWLLCLTRMRMCFCFNRGGLGCNADVYFRCTWWHLNCKQKPLCFWCMQEVDLKGTCSIAPVKYFILTSWLMLVRDILHKDVS